MVFSVDLRDEDEVGVTIDAATGAVVDDEPQAPKALVDKLRTLFGTEYYPHNLEKIANRANDHFPVISAILARYPLNDREELLPQVYAACDALWQEQQQQESAMSATWSAGMTLAEAEELEGLEAVIDDKITAFCEVGCALMEIRDKKLYRLTHKTFEDYCEERWSFGRRYAYKLMSASGVIEKCAKFGTKPTKMSHALLLAEVSPELQAEVWQQCLDTFGDKLTAKQVGTVVGQYLIEEEKPSNKMAVHHSSKSVEWPTPDNVIRLLEACLGEIDTDPCAEISPDEGEPNIPASIHYTKAQDGLTRPWVGKVFMNPPYGAEIGDWVEKLLLEFEDGNCDEAIALLPGRIDTEWNQRLRGHLRCEVRGRLTFKGATAPAPFPSIFYYLGDNPRKFIEVFSEIGDCWRLTLADDYDDGGQASG